MLLKSLIQPKAQLTTVKESTTLAQALTILEDTGYRCVPILDRSGQIFRGNIYKLHLYRHKARGGAMDIPATHLLKNATKFIPLDAPFFKAFFTIKDLPYIAVLDQQNYFYGILTHNHLMTFLAQSWNINRGGFVLNITATQTQETLPSLTKLISRYTTIINCITFNLTQQQKQHILITLPTSVTPEMLQKIIDHLQRKGFLVPVVEDLRTE